MLVDSPLVDVEALGLEADRICERLARKLEIDLSDWPSAEVVVAQGQSSVVGRKIRVCPKPGDKNLSSADWFALLFGHELTHLLLSDNWGMAPTLFWEGVPIYMADNHIRSQALGFNYHQYCRALLENDNLLSLAELLLPRKYYARRTDSRVDIQAGSFCGFLLERQGPSAMRGLFSDYVEPTAQAPLMRLTPLLEKHFAADISLLEQDWIGFLNEKVSYMTSLGEKVRARKSTEHAPGLLRCNFCGHQLTENHRECSSCGVNADIEIRIE